MNISSLTESLNSMVNYRGDITEISKLTKTMGDLNELNTFTKKLNDTDGISPISKRLDEYGELKSIRKGLYDFEELNVFKKKANRVPGLLGLVKNKDTDQIKNNQSDQKDEFAETDHIEKSPPGLLLEGENTNTSARASVSEYRDHLLIGQPWYVRKNWFK